MDLFNYIFDFVSGVDDGFREIEKEIERLFVRQILAPAKKYEINQIEQESKKNTRLTINSIQESLSAVNNKIDVSMKGEFASKVIETIDSKNKEYKKLLEE